MENSNLLKPSYGQQDYLEAFSGLSYPYMGKIYVNKINSKKFITGTSYHDGVDDDRYKANDSSIFEKKIKKFLEILNIKTMAHGHQLDQLHQIDDHFLVNLNQIILLLLD